MSRSPGAPTTTAHFDSQDKIATVHGANTRERITLTTSLLRRTRPTYQVTGAATVGIGRQDGRIAIQQSRRLRHRHTRQTGIFQDMSGLSVNQLIALQCWINLVRDYVWPWRSYEGGNMGDQQIYSSLAMLGACAVVAIGCKLFQAKKGIPWVAMTAFFAGAAAAIVPWDFGADEGDLLGLRGLHMKAGNAGYFSSVLTGGFEGPTQYITINLVAWLLKSCIKSTHAYQRHRRLHVSSNPYTLKEAGLSLLPGLIPGGVWQLVYNAGVLNNWDKASLLGPHLIYLAVALAVCLCNALYGKFLACLMPTDNESKATTHRSSRASLQMRASPAPASAKGGTQKEHPADSLLADTRPKIYHCKCPH